MTPSMRLSAGKDVGSAEVRDGEFERQTRSSVDAEGIGAMSLLALY